MEMREKNNSRGTRRREKEGGWDRWKDKQRYHFGDSDGWRKGEARESSSDIDILLPQGRERERERKHMSDGEMYFGSRVQYIMLVFVWKNMSSDLKKIQKQEEKDQPSPYIYIYIYMCVCVCVCVCVRLFVSQ